MSAPKPKQFKPEGPQPLIRETPAGEPFPVDSLGPLKEVVEAVRDMTQAPVAIPAASALSVASIAVHGFADVETLGGPRPVSLYALTIARSGERKSSCDKPLLAGLSEHEKEQARKQRDEFNAWENKHALWKAQRDRILALAKKSKNKQDLDPQIELDDLGPEPAAPPSADRVVTEPTFEGLTRLFTTGQPSLGIFSDEGGQFLGGHAMNSDNRQKTLAALNALWQGEPIRRTRQGEGNYTLYGRRLAIHLMVQPSVARSFMSDPMATDSGFLARFLICEPPSTIGSRLYRKSRRNGEAISQFNTRLRDVLRQPLPMDPETLELKPRILQLSEQARTILVEFHDAMEAQQAPGKQLADITSHASKSAEQAARIAGVLTLWADLKASEVSGEAMANGIQLAQFYLSEARRLADAAIVSKPIDDAETLRLWLLEKWEHPEITSRDVVRFGPGRLRESPKARKCLQILEEHGWLRRLDEGTVVRGSSRKEAWRIVREAVDVV